MRGVTISKSLISDYGVSQRGSFRGTVVSGINWLNCRRTSLLANSGRSAGPLWKVTPSKPPVQLAGEV